MVGSPCVGLVIFFFSLIATCCKPWTPFTRSACKSWDGNRWQRILSGSVLPALSIRQGRLALPLPRSPSCPLSCPALGLSGCGVYRMMSAADLQTTPFNTDYLSIPLGDFNSPPSPSSPNVFVKLGLAWLVLFCLLVLVLVLVSTNLTLDYCSGQNVAWSLLGHILTPSAIPEDYVETH